MFQKSLINYYEYLTISNTIIFMRSKLKFLPLCSLLGHSSCKGPLHLLNSRVVCFMFIMMIIFCFMLICIVFLKLKLKKMVISSPLDCKLMAIMDNA